MKRVISGIYTCFCYISAVSFAVSCNIILFIHSNGLNFNISETELRNNAAIPFVNVVIISVIYIVIDTIYKKIIIHKKVESCAVTTSLIVGTLILSLGMSCCMV